MILLTINGLEIELANNTTIEDYLHIHRLAGHKALAVARNGIVLTKQEHPSTLLLDGDIIEIVRAIGGG